MLPHKQAGATDAVLSKLPILGDTEGSIESTVPVVHCAARTESYNRDVSTSRWDSQCAQRNEL